MTNEEKRLPDSDQESNGRSPSISSGDTEAYDDARQGDRLFKLLSAIPDQFESLSAKLSALEKALAVQRSGTSEQILAQLLAMSRETLVKVSAPPPTASELIEPLLRDLVGLIFNLDKLLEAQPNSTLEALRGFVADIAERYGVQFYAPQPGDVFVPALANAVETQKVLEKEEGGKVIRIVRVGCRLQEKLLYYPQVCVSRFSSESGNI